MLFSRLSKIYTKKGVFGALLPRISAKNAIFVQLLRIEYEHRQPRYSKTTDSRKGKRAGGVQGKPPGSWSAAWKRSALSLTAKVARCCSV